MILCFNLGCKTVNFELEDCDNIINRNSALLGSCYSKVCKKEEKLLDGKGKTNEQEMRPNYGFPYRPSDGFVLVVGVVAGNTVIFTLVYHMWLWPIRGWLAKARLSPSWGYEHLGKPYK